MLIRAALVIGATYLFGHWLAGVAVLALAAIWWLLPRSEGPPVLALALTMQWVQVTIGVFYTGLTGRPVEAILRSDYQPMVLIGLGCVLAMAAGLAAGSAVVRRQLPGRPFAPEEIVTFRTLLILYVLAIAVTGTMQEVAFRYPQFTQAILALSFARLGVLALLLRRLIMPTIRAVPLLAVLGFEVVLGFTAYFADFKEPLLLAALAMIEVFDTRRREHWLTAGALVAVLGFTVLMWLSVRTEYRRDFYDEAFAQSRSARLERISALASDWFYYGRGGLSEDVDFTIDRIWAVYYPALAVERIPALLPHTDGQLMADTIRHLVTPRIIFPDKPDLPSDSEFVRKYSGVRVAGAEFNTNIAFGYAAESYVDFGLPWMFVPPAVFGLLMGVAYQWLLRAIIHRELAIGLVTCIFWLNLHLFERSWPKMIGLALTTMVYLGLVAFVVDRWLAARRPLPVEPFDDDGEAQSDISGALEAPRVERKAG
jgi:hypothetical protein